MELLGRDFTSGTTTDSNGRMIQERGPLSDRYVLQCFTASKEPSSEAENVGPYSDTMLITGRSFALHQPRGASTLQPKIVLAYRPVLKQQTWDGRADPEGCRERLALSACHSSAARVEAPGGCGQSWWSLGLCFSPMPPGLS